MAALYVAENIKQKKIRCLEKNCCNCDDDYKLVILVLTAGVRFVGVVTAVVVQVTEVRRRDAVAAGWTRS